MARLGELERAVMEHLWAAGETQIVRQVFVYLSSRRELAYTTVMTVLQRLAKKGLVDQRRTDRAHQYSPVHSRDELVAGLMVDALAAGTESGERVGALVRFVEQVTPDEADALRAALAALESRTKTEPAFAGSAPVEDT